MSIEEKKDRLLDYCNLWDKCADGCLLRDIDCECDSLDECTEAELDYVLSIINDTPVESKPTDIINKSPHYNNGGIETIDEMVLVFGKEAVKHFCLCNVWKYRARAIYKNGEEDMKKADYYMKKYKELCDE